MTQKTQTDTDEDKIVPLNEQAAINWANAEQAHVKQVLATHNEAVVNCDAGFIVVMAQSCTDPMGLGIDIDVPDIEGWIVYLFEDVDTANAPFGEPIEWRIVLWTQWNKIAEAVEELGGQALALVGHNEKMEADPIGANGVTHINGYSVAVEVVEYDFDACIDLLVKDTDGKIIFWHIISYTRVVDALREGEAVIEAHKANGEQGVFDWAMKGNYKVD